MLAQELGDAGLLERPLGNRGHGVHERVVGIRSSKPFNSRNTRAATAPTLLLPSTKGCPSPGGTREAAALWMQSTHRY
jgi:hypothetical protein